MFRDHISLMHGWVPLSVQVLAAVLLALGIGVRTRRWRVSLLPWAVAFGIALIGVTHWAIVSNGLSGEPAPPQLWVWVGLTGLAIGVAVLGWHSVPTGSPGWWRRVVSVLAVPMAALSAGLMLNLWVGYFPTVQAAWGQLSGGPLPGQTDPATVAGMLAAQTIPPAGRVVPITTPSDVSKFKHRGELVYLPPVYFASNPPPALPTVMMIGGQFNTPADWIRTADAVHTIDEFAARHGGNAPVFVFPDSGGAFNNDTECVNGVRGNAADHLTREVRPHVIANFGVNDDPAAWGVVGWSSGGTCALNLTVKYPDLFRTFVNIDGDLAPNAGTREQTIDRLYGGDAQGWHDWDPATVMARHGDYGGVAGWFAVSEPVGVVGLAASGADLQKVPEESDPAANPSAAARTLCRIGSQYGIDCAVVPQPGKHDWPFAAEAFRNSLPWLAGRLGTPGVAEVALPAAIGDPPAPRPPGVR